MRRTVQLLLPALVLILLSLSMSGCGCGFDCNSNDDDNPTGPALLTLGLSDSLPEDLKKVVIEVASISFKRSGVDAVVVEKFTIDGLETENFGINLLDYPGDKQRKVIEALELDTGTYDVSIKINSDDDNKSYVEEANDNRRPITVKDGTLTIPGMKLASGTQVFTVEFALAQALTQMSNNNYLLSTTGIRIENNLTGALLSGEVDSALFDTVSPCREKNPPTSGNRVYLYKDFDLAIDLIDVSTSDSETSPPANAIAPFAVASLTQNTVNEKWAYAFGYLPAGEYTLAFACNTADDDAIEYDALVIPQPEQQKYKITLTKAKKSICNLTAAADCK